MIHLRTTLILATIAAGGLSILDIRDAAATNICVEFKRAEFPHSRTIRGQANSCNDAAAASTAKARAKGGAYDALDQLCANSVTSAMAAKACSRHKLFVRRDGFWPWGLEIRPASRIDYKTIGKNAAGDTFVCLTAQQRSFKTTYRVDGTCEEDTGFEPLRSYGVARYRARCAVVCSTD